MITNKQLDDSLKKCTGYRLIMPAVAVGNVGQLAVDLLLSALSIEHIGYLQNSLVLPMVGPDPFDPQSHRLVTNWEVYACHQEKLVIVQQRAPVVPGKMQSYIEYLTKWIESQKFSSVVLLSSSFSQFFSSSKIEGVPMHYLCTSSTKSVENDLKGLKWKEFDVEAFKADDSNKLRVPGGGATEHLFQSCQEKEIPLIVMICVCSEGNNYPEGIKMADCLNSWLNVFQKEDGSSSWKIPVSWSVPFGSSPPPTMF